MNCNDKQISSSCNYSLVDFQTPRGNDFARTLEFEDPEGNPEADFMGSTFEMKVTDTFGGVVLTFNPNPESPNVLNLVKTAEQMNIPTGTYSYYLNQSRPDGTIDTRLKGKFTIC